MQTADPVVYLKKSLKLLWNKPRLKNLISVILYYPAWREHLRPGRNSVDDRTPWVSFAAVGFLQKITRGDMRVFEYGSGGSTMFWISRVNTIISVEHDMGWYNKMKEVLEQQKMQNVDYILAEPATDPDFKNKQYTNPDHFISGDVAYQGENFESYVKTIDPYPDEFFDIIVVDGRARPSCVKHSINKLKKGGYLIVDNAERKYYLDPFEFPKPAWKVYNFEGPVPYVRDFSTTTILKKEL